jgi:dimethylhistidine N-methyltransferase
MTLPSAHPRIQLVGLEAEKRRAAFARDVALGLTAVPKRLSCCYFYDRLGSALFEAICCLPEYYLTRAEEEILRTHSDDIASLFAAPTDLIELGSGSAAKTRLLINAFLRRHQERFHLQQRYIAVDICRTVLEEASLELVHAYPTLSVLAIAGEYREALEHFRRTDFQSVPHHEESRRRLVLWLGSNIGNLERDAAAHFLAELRESLLPDDRLLLGIDLRKDRTVLEAAYDDPCGVTAAFNRNLLARINRELAGHFDLRTFQHRAVYNEGIGRIEMYLVSDRAQAVAINHLRLAAPFAAGEPIHTENSYKYSPAEIDALADDAGMRRERTWFDEERRFSVSLFLVESK